MKVLVVGGGGREHALAWKLAAAPRVTEVLVAPGNAGTAAEPRCRNAKVAADDVEGLLSLAQTEAVDFTVVGPEAALAAGIVDRFQAAGLRIFGPTRAAAELESSKAFMKALLARQAIPTARYAVFSDATAALTYVAEHGAPIVIKADGLAAGKGVTVATTREQAETAVRECFAGRFGSAGARVVIEDVLQGEEASYIVIASGADYVPLASSQDHKRVGDGDTGPNTGGMGAYSPAPVVTAEVEARIQSRIIEPALVAMAADGRPFTGFLYAGLMIDANGEPAVVEFNVRLGDPEAQPLLMRLDSDLLEVLEAALDGKLAELAPLNWNPAPALGVVMTSAGYPGHYQKGLPITGLGTPSDVQAKVFHAGTRQDDDGTVVTNGGRVLCVTALGATLVDAAASAYRSAGAIHFAGAHYRHDIGHHAREHLG
ncbi:MAG TPA: phosphoribosylamine--glycine ligase [Nevskiaceae bacterium]|nr:phosphoribosylamine--glycine ligase [Nevskiaceae bacterium]